MPFAKVMAAVITAIFAAGCSGELPIERKSVPDYKKDRQDQSDQSDEKDQEDTTVETAPPPSKEELAAQSWQESINNDNREECAILQKHHGSLVLTENTETAFHVAAVKKAYLCIAGILNSESISSLEQYKDINGKSAFDILYDANDFEAYKLFFYKFSKEKRKEVLKKAIQDGKELIAAAALYSVGFHTDDYDVVEYLSEDHGKITDDKMVNFISYGKDKFNDSKDKKSLIQLSIDKDYTLSLKKSIDTFGIDFTSDLALKSSRASFFKSLGVFEYAIVQNSVKCVIWLLDNSALSIDLKNLKSQKIRLPAKNILGFFEDTLYLTSLDYAYASGKIEVIKTIEARLEGLEGIDDTYHTFFAAINGKQEVLETISFTKEEMLDSFNIDIFLTPMQIAVIFDNVFFLEKAYQKFPSLISEPYSEDENLDRSYNLLHLAAAYGHVGSISFLHERDTSLITQKPAANKIAGYWDSDFQDYQPIDIAKELNKGFSHIDAINLLKELEN